MRAGGPARGGRGGPGRPAPKFVVLRPAARPAPQIRRSGAADAHIPAGCARPAHSRRCDPRGRHHGASRAHATHFWSRTCASRTEPAGIACCGHVAGSVCASGARPLKQHDGIALGAGAHPQQRERARPMHHEALAQPRERANEARLCRLSASSSTTQSTSPSRSFRARRRSRACPSFGRVSASTPMRHGPCASRPEITASHARRSPAAGRGTSVAKRSERWRWTRARSSSAPCAASRSGGPDGYARSDRSRPTTASISAAVAIARAGASPRSIRL